MDLLVSIVIPVYNVESYLRECIDSIVAQTYRTLEIILVNDGSTDSSGMICDEYAAFDKRIVVIHKPNGGLSDARNAGAAVAHGDFLYFCDSDDYLDLNAIKILATTITKHSSEVVIFNATAFEDGTNDFVRNKYARKHLDASESSAELAMKQFIFDEFKPCAYLFFFSHAFYQKYSLQFQKDILHEDELFSYYVYKYVKKIVYINKSLYYRRIRSGSIMTSKSNRLKKFHSNLYIFTQISQDNVNKDYQPVRNEFLSRIGKSMLYNYRGLSNAKKMENHQVLKRAINSIRLHKGYGDCSLYLRTYCWWPGVFLSFIRKKLRMWKYEK